MASIVEAEDLTKVFNGTLTPVANVNPTTKAIEISRLFVIQGSLAAAQYTSVIYDFTYLGFFAGFFTVLGAIAARVAFRRD